MLSPKFITDASIYVKSTKSCDFVLLRKIYECDLFYFSCCVVAVTAEWLVDVGLAQDYEFVTLGETV